MLSRRRFFGGVAGLLAFLGLGRRVDATQIETVVQLKLAPKGDELFRKLAESRLIENGIASGLIRGDELRDLATAMLRAADMQQERRTFIFDIAADEAWDGRWGYVILNAEGMPSRLGLEIWPTWEPLSEYRQRLGVNNNMRARYDREARLWMIEERKEG